MKQLIQGLCLLLIVIMAACHKPQPKGSTTFTTSDTFFRFINIKPFQVRLDMYKTQEDEYNNTNLAFTCLVPGDGEVDIPMRLVDTSTTYYYDFYSADFSYTNWGINSDDEVKLGMFGLKRFQLPDFPLSGSRSAFLRGNNVSVTWKAVNYYGSSLTPAWSSLNDNQKYKVLVLYKNLNAFLYHKNGSGSIVVDSAYETYNAGSSLPACCFGLTFYGFTDYLYNCSTPLNAFNSPVVVSKDTILLTDNLGYWIMVPQ